jgi:hypothetical protein
LDFSVWFYHFDGRKLPLHILLLLDLNSIIMRIIHPKTHTIPHSHKLPLKHSFSNQPQTSCFSFLLGLGAVPKHKTKKKKKKKKNQTITPAAPTKPNFCTLEASKLKFCTANSL